MEGCGGSLKSLSEFPVSLIVGVGGPGTLSVGVPLSRFLSRQGETRRRGL